MVLIVAKFAASTNAANIPSISPVLRRQAGLFTLEIAEAVGHVLGQLADRSGVSCYNPYDKSGTTIYEILATIPG